MSSNGNQPETIAPGVDRGWLRERVLELSSIHRPSASEGEREAAELIAADLTSVGARARVEVEQAHGHYWIPLALLSALGATAGLVGRRRPLLGGALGALVCAALWDDLTGGEHHFRKLLPRRPTYNVVAEIGPQHAERTVVIVSHHDAARSGLIFHPRIPEFVGEHFPAVIEASDTSPALMWPVFGGPALATIGSLVRNRLLRGLGTVLSAGSALTFAEIGTRDVVPGANDNITGAVTLMALARVLADDPPINTRVMLVSTGAEESFMEGMHAFSKRHFASLPQQSTFFLCVDTVGSPHLSAPRGEGMLKMFEYPEEALAVVDTVAADLDIQLVPNLRFRNATDGLYPLRAGYPSAFLGSVTEYKAPSHYHWPSDHAGNVNYDTHADAVRLCKGIVRRLDDRWLD